MKQQNTTQVLLILGALLPFIQKKLDGLLQDYLTLLGKKMRFKYLRSSEALLSFWQSAYIKAERRFNTLESIWKSDTQKLRESEVHYHNLVTLVDAKSLTPIDRSDSLQDAEPIAFKRAEQNTYEPLKEGAISEEHLTPDTDSLKAKSPKLVAELMTIINQLSFRYFSKVEREMLAFRVFPDRLPEPTNEHKKSMPKRMNVLGFLTIKWSVALFLTYIFALSGELLVFLNISENVLNFTPLKSWFFSLAIAGISYLVALYFFRYVLTFLRSKNHIPALLKVFVSLVIVYVLASGFLSFQMQQKRQVETEYLAAIQGLNNLQLQQFSAPVDTSIQQEIDLQQQRVQTLEQTIGNPSTDETVVSGVLYVLMSCMSIFSSALILAVLLCVGRVNALKRTIKRAKKSLTETEAEYTWRISQFKKARELMGMYIFELSRLQSIETLLVAPPSEEELIESSNDTPPQSPVTKQKLEQEDAPEKIEVKEPEILSTEAYSEL